MNIQETVAGLLDARLATALDFVRQDAYVADIGTDHAYLPAALVRCGRARGAIAADLRAGPLAHAAATVEKFGLGARIQLIQTDGLAGLAQSGVTDVVIFGMGGELIARILADAPFVRDAGIRLILQPMTQADRLRSWLVGEGFAFVGERISCVEGKLYQTICAEFCGQPSTLTPIAAELGPCNLAERPPLLSLLAAHKADILAVRIAGRERAGFDTTAEREMLACLRAIAVETEENHDH